MKGARSEQSKVTSSSVEGRLLKEPVKSWPLLLLKGARVSSQKSLSAVLRRTQNRLESSLPLGAWATASATKLRLLLVRWVWSSTLLLAIDYQNWQPIHVACAICRLKSRELPEFSLHLPAWFVLDVGGIRSWADEASLIQNNSVYLSVSSHKIHKMISNK